MTTISQKTAAAMRETQETFLALSGTIGLIVAALPPALMFMLATQRALVGEVGVGGSWAVAIALAVALETAGVKVSHNALTAFADARRGDQKSQTDFYWLAGLTVLYLAAGAIAIAFFDQDRTIRIGGFLSYAVAGIMYVGSGFEYIRHEARQGLLTMLQADNKQLQADNKALQCAAEREQSNERQWQMTAEAAQGAATEWENKAQQLQAANGRLQKRLDSLQGENSELQKIAAAWASMNEEAQTLARFNAHLIDATEAAAILDVKDPRTVKSRAEKLNGVTHG